MEEWVDEYFILAGQRIKPLNIWEVDGTWFERGAAES